MDCAAPCANVGGLRFANPPYVLIAGVALQRSDDQVEIVMDAADPADEFLDWATRLGEAFNYFWWLD